MTVQQRETLIFEGRSLYMDPICLPKDIGQLRGERLKNSHEVRPCQSSGRWLTGPACRTLL